MKIWEAVNPHKLKRGDRIIIATPGAETMIEEKFLKIKHLERGFAIKSKNDSSRSTTYFYDH